MRSGRPSSLSAANRAYARSTEKLIMLLAGP
jgi:hypothetical protein